jgi:hypothetical protein
MNETTKFKVWLGNGSMLDGERFDAMDEAIDAIQNHYGWDGLFTVDHDLGGAWSCYETEEEAEEDVDGIYAPTITEILECGCTASTGCDCEFPREN